MKIDYCERWWLSRKKAVKVMSADAARRRHDAREPYVALIGGAEAPRFVVDLAGKWVSVVFLDHHLRQFLCYDFKERSPGRIFLNLAYHWEYEGDSDTAGAKRMFSFDEDGTILIEDHDVKRGTVRKLESHASAAENWDAYPNFGEYEALCKSERSLSNPRPA